MTDTKLTIHELSRKVDPDLLPIEVWLSQTNLAITCTVVHEDESREFKNIHSLSIRGAQREITGWLITSGYKPDGRWEVTAYDQGEARETVRRFKHDVSAIFK